MEMYIDEAGRWPFAGPLYVGIILPLKKFSTKGFKDSKVLSEKQREELYAKILQLAEEGKLLFASGNVSHTVIDQKGLTKAINWAVRRAITAMAGHKVSNCSKRTKIALVQLKEKTGNEKEKIGNVLIIDGKHDFGLGKDLGVETKTIVDGDALNPFIGMASIVAKVERDHVMLGFAKKYPEYGFEKHKGYGTEFHREMIKKFGPCKIHRRSFLKKILGLE